MTTIRRVPFLILFTIYDTMYVCFCSSIVPLWAEIIIDLDESPFKWLLLAQMAHESISNNMQCRCDSSMVTVFHSWLTQPSPDTCDILWMPVGLATWLIVIIIISGGGGGSSGRKGNKFVRFVFPMLELCRLSTLPLTFIAMAWFIHRTENFRACPSIRLHSFLIISLFPLQTSLYYSYIGNWCDLFTRNCVGRYGQRLRQITGSSSLIRKQNTHTQHSVYRIGNTCSMHRYGCNRNQSNGRVTRLSAYNFNSFICFIYMSRGACEWGKSMSI